MSSFFNILQITDIHFRKQVSGTIYGVETQILFERTLEQIKNEIAVAGEKVDLLLATGDISQDGSAESYKRFHDFVSGLDVPAYYLQGNHDYVQPMIDEFGSDFVAPCVVSPDHMNASPWKVLMINSSVEDQVGGHFGEEQLEYLDAQLKRLEGSPVLLCFHHHPMLIDCAWLDKQVIDDAADFFKVIDKYSNIKLCIYGHVHQDRLMVRNDIPYYATPSTCAQFKPESDDFALDNLAPAYRWIRCFDNGHFETEVKRLEGFDFSSVRSDK